MSLALARRYARALADVLFEEKRPSAPPPRTQGVRLRELKEQLAEFAALLAEHVALRNILASPATAREERLAVLEALGKRLRLAPTAHNFLVLLMENRRLELLALILESFDTEVYARLGIVPVEVTTAVGLSPKQKKDLEMRLRTLTGTQVEARYRESPGILSGGIVRVGTTIYDGSLQVQLRRLEAQLARE